MPVTAKNPKTYTPAEAYPVETGVLPSPVSLTEICDELKKLQRDRRAVMKSRMMSEQRIRAVVAGSSGYSTQLDEKERKKKFQDAAETIEQVLEGKIEHPLQVIIKASYLSIDVFYEIQKNLEKPMTALAKKLPVAKWILEPEQCGVSMLGLATLIGETGDLNGYGNPGKVWRRLGCAPWTHNGETKMGATWRRDKNLPKAEWEAFGYSPRRRSIAYLVGVGLLKSNKSIYKERYTEAKERAAENHPEWIKCKCDGTGTQASKKGTKEVTCEGCAGKGQKMMRCHMHGLLLCTKLFLKNLWIEWRRS